MRPTIVLCAVIGLAGCASGGQGAAPATTHATPVSNPTTPSPSPTTSGPSPSPTPTSTPRLIAKTEADKAICKGFLTIGHKLHGRKITASYYMGFIAFGAGEGTSRRASGKLITVIVTWWDDSHMSFGNPSNVPSDLAAVRADCASIGVTKGF
jgi:hypothetical protein